jgi:hypothetical protein
MRVLRTLLITSLLVAGASCGGDDDTASTEPTPEPTASAPATEPTTTPTTTAMPTTAPPTTAPPTTTPITTTPTTTAPPTTAPTATTTPPPPPVDVRVYFLRGERLVIDHRDVAGPAVLGAALTALLEGPTGDLVTTIPDGTELLGVNLVDGTATVDLSQEFGTGGGSLSMTARVAQVVFTTTQFDNVDQVVFWIDGGPIEYLGGEGLIMTEPWTRADVSRELTGSVLVDRPHPGDTVTSPFTVTGEADVYEGDFPIEIRRGDTVLATIAPVRGGAWGNWADFSATVTLDAAPGPIELVAYDEGGCGDAPECPPIIETVVPLTLG